MTRSLGTRTDQSSPTLLQRKAFYLSHLGYTENCVQILFFVSELVLDKTTVAVAFDYGTRLLPKNLLDSLGILVQCISICRYLQVQLLVASKVILHFNRVRFSEQPAQDTPAEASARHCDPDMALAYLAYPPTQPEGCRTKCLA